MIELNGKYTNCILYANTIEEGVYTQVYDIINSKAFINQKIYCMPDVHVGKSGPCGLTATIGNYVSPEHVGVDIGCRVSFMQINKPIPVEKYPEFEHKLRMSIPSGFNIHKKRIFNDKEFYRFLSNGFSRYKQYWMEMLSALPDSVDEKWVTAQLKRLNMNEGIFYKSIGSIGSGNHYCEYGEDIINNVYGISVHCGSRNFGVKVCKYWMSKTSSGLSKNEIKDLTHKFKEEYKKSHSNMLNFKEDLNKYLDKQNENHINGYLTGDLMKGYLCDLCFAELYAEWNHRCIFNEIKKKILQIYGIKEVKFISSVHNFIDLTDHILRKSAIRSYKNEEILIPFNMRDGLAICVGKSNDDWNCSAPHGAGRIMSRAKAKSNIDLEEFKKTMEGIYSTSVGVGTLDESPMAYKDTNEILELIKPTCDVLFMIKPKINIKAVESYEE